MRILDIREITVPINVDMSNAFINFSKMDVSVVAIITDEWRDGEQLVGYGFHSNGRYSQGGILRQRLIPRVLEADPDSLLSPDTGQLDPRLIWRAAMRDEKPGGHGDRAVAMGTLDMAAWDLGAKLAALPLHRFLAATAAAEGAPPVPLDRIWVYAAGGYYYPGRGLDALNEEMLSYVELGYRAVKMKIGGAPLASDIERIESVLDVLPEGCSLAVDANGRLSVPEAIEYARALAGYPLAWYEEPVDPLDYQGLSKVAEQYDAPLATGENLLSEIDVRNLLRHGGLRPNQDVLQMDPSLSYGLTEFIETLQDLRQSGWDLASCVPHGGHQFNLGIAAGFHLRGCESYPGIFAPFGGFADGHPVTDGYVTLPEAPGVGLEAKSSLQPVLEEVAGPRGRTGALA